MPHANSSSGAHPAVESISIRTADGAILGATLVVPRDPVAVAVLSGGTAIPHRYYLRYAEYLAQRNYACLCYDYRGVGASRPPRLRGYRATMLDWGAFDIPAAWREARRQFPDLPLAALGHSVGGQMAAVAARAGLTPDALVLIAASTGTWWRMPPAFGAYCAALWYVAAPVLTRSFGYFPTSKLGLGEDLPAGVARQWARWCCRDDYFGELADGADPVRFDALRVPAYALSFSDDPIANRRTVAALHALLSGLQPECRWIEPRTFGQKRIGHIGFFSARSPAALWSLPADWLDRRFAGRDRRRDDDAAASGASGSAAIPALAPTLLADAVPRPV
jgi:predicted alpha/beta hydrolase